MKPIQKLVFQILLLGYCSKLVQAYCSIPYVQHSIETFVIKGYTLYNTSRYVPGSIISYACDDGYTIYGDNTLRCGLFGVFTPSPPKCLRHTLAGKCKNEYENIYAKQRGLSYKVQANYHPFQEEYKIGSKLNFQCPPNTYMRGDYLFLKFVELKCVSDFKWSGSWPYCQEQVCSERFVDGGDFTIVGNQTNSYLVGTKIKYRCHPGRILEGATDDECLKNGNWKNAEPECVDKNVFRNRCTLDGKKLQLEPYPHCVTKTSKEQLAAESQLNTITIVTSTAAAIFGILLLIVAIVAFQRRRILHQIRRAREQEAQDNYNELDDDQPLVHFVLPSYDEAVRSKPTSAPPSFEESMQASSPTEEQQSENSQPMNRTLAEFVETRLLSEPSDNADDGEDIVVSLETDSPPPYPGNNRITSISSDGSSFGDATDETQLINST